MFNNFFMNHKRGYKISVLLILFLFIIPTFILSGCGKDKKKSKIKEETVSSEDGFIVVGEDEKQGKKDGYTTINSVRGYSFDVRTEDFSQDYKYNSTEILDDTDKVIKYYYNRYKFKEHCIDGDYLIQTDDTFVLHREGKSAYFFKADTELGKSLKYFKTGIDYDGLLMNTIGKYMDISFVCDTENITYSGIDETGEYGLKMDVSFSLGKMDDCKGSVYIWENDNGQSIFFAGGNEYFYEDEREWIYSSINIADEDKYVSGINTYETSSINIDYGGVLLKGEFSDLFSLNGDLTNENRYVAFSSWNDDYCPYFVNPYYNIMIKYNVYTLKGPVTSEDFLKSRMYYHGDLFFSEEGKVFRHIDYYSDNTMDYYDLLIQNKKSESLADKNGNKWDVYRVEFNSTYKKLFNNFSNTSIYIRMNGNECVLFQIWYNRSEKDLIEALMNEGVSSITTEVGQSTRFEPFESGIKKYDEYFGIVDEPVVASLTDAATPTDAETIVIEQ